MYLLAVVMPPIAVLLTGRPVQALLCVPLTMFGWLPGVIHAVAVVGDSKANGRNRKLIRAVRAAR